MASAIAKVAAKKIVGEKAKEFFPTDNEFYGNYRKVPIKYNKKGKATKFEKKEFHIEGISEKDLKILKSVKKTAKAYDQGFHFLGIKFGMSAIIGLAPFIGDFADAIMGLMLVANAQRAKPGTRVLGLMCILCFADFIIGLVPVLGDLADMAFRCNTGNAKILEMALVRKYKKVALKKSKGTITVEGDESPTHEMTETRSHTSHARVEPARNESLRHDGQVRVQPTRNETLHYDITGGPSRPPPAYSRG